MTSCAIRFSRGTGTPGLAVIVQHVKAYCKCPESNCCNYHDPRLFNIHWSALYLYQHKFAMKKTTGVRNFDQSDVNTGWRLFPVTQNIRLSATAVQSCALFL